MTLFDVIAAGILALSALVGFSRGAVREVISLFAFTFAALASVFLLPLSRPLARHAIHPSWAANGVAVIIVFLLAYVALRVVGASLSRTLHRRATLGTLDRSLGMGFGIVRALVFLGVFYLVFNAATPADMVPGWISRSALYPLSRVSAKALQLAAPGGLKAMGGFGHLLKDRVSADDGASKVGGQEPYNGGPDPTAGTSTNLHERVTEPSPDASVHLYDDRPVQTAHHRHVHRSDRDADQVN